MIEFQATNPTYRTVMGSGRFPFAIAIAFVAVSKVSILVDALVWLGQGFFIRHMVVWNIV